MKKFQLMDDCYHIYAFTCTSQIDNALLATAPRKKSFQKKENHFYSQLGLGLLCELVDVNLLSQTTVGSNCLRVTSQLLESLDILVAEGI